MAKKKDYSDYGGMPEGESSGCYKCGAKKSVRRVAVVVGVGEFHTDLEDIEICARCANDTSVSDIVRRLDSPAEDDKLPDYPGDK